MFPIFKFTYYSALNAKLYMFNLKIQLSSFRMQSLQMPNSLISTLTILQFQHVWIPIQKVKFQHFQNLRFLEMKHDTSEDVPIFSCIV